MKIAFMHPTYWPEVRRGSERLVHDLAAGLAARGHELTLITSHPGPGSVSAEDDVRVIRNRRPPWIRPLRFYEDHVASLPASSWSLARGGFDLAHAFFPGDAWAAAQVRRRAAGPPFLFSLHGIPVRRYLVERRYRLEMLRTAIDAAAATTVLSEAAAEATRTYLIRSPLVIPGGVDLRSFAADVAPAPVPTVVCAASLQDPRKRPEVLFEAFGILRSRIPEARLRLIRSLDPLLAGWPAVALPEGAEWVEATGTDQLAREYAGAHVSVTAAVDEAFGLVLIESLAAGTPIVAARSGASAEIIDSDAIGRLFEPDDAEDLARALEQGIVLGRDPATTAACRVAAARFDLELLLDRYERLYEAALTGEPISA